MTPTRMAAPPRQGSAAQEMSNTDMEKVTQKRAGGNPSPPTIHPVNAETIPQALKEIPRWIVWRLGDRRPSGGWEKLPTNPRNSDQNISARKPKNWMTFEQALRFYSSGKFAGLGFVPKPGDGFVFLDPDHVVLDRDTATLAPLGQEAVELCDTYWEFSPTDGLRGIGRGSVPEGKHAFDGFQIYGGDESVQFITISGNVLPGNRGEIKELQPETMRKVFDLAKRSEAEKASSKTEDNTLHQGGAAGPSPEDLAYWEQRRERVALVSDEELVRRLCQDESRRALWEGDWSSHKSQSEADLALANHLAFFTGCDEERTEELFRKSGLMREKFDEARPGGTYGRVHVIKPAILDTMRTHQRKDAPAGLKSLYAASPLTGSDLGRCAPPPRSWVTTGAGALPRGVVGVFAGQGGAGKTYVEIQQAMSVATGQNCCDAFTFAAVGPVVAVLAEDDAEEVERRIYHTRQSYQGQDLDLSNLHFFTAGGGDPLLVKRDAGGNLQVTQGFHDLMEHARRIQPVLIVLDSLSVVASSAETSNEDAARFISLVSEFTTLPSKPSVVVLTHVNKSSLSTKGGGQGKQNPEQGLEAALDPSAVRGASALTFNARWCMTLTLVPAGMRRKLGAGTKPLVAYAVLKNNYAPRLERAYLQADEHGVLHHFDAVEVRAVNLSQEIIREIEAQGGVHKKEFLDSKADSISAELRARVMCTRIELRDTIKKLLESGELMEEKREGLKYLVTSTGGF